MPIWSVHTISRHKLLLLAPIFWKVGKKLKFQVQFFPGNKNIYALHFWRTKRTGKTPRPFSAGELFSMPPLGWSLTFSHTPANPESKIQEIQKIEPAHSHLTPSRFEDTDCGLSSANGMPFIHGPHAFRYPGQNRGSAKNWPQIQPIPIEKCKIRRNLNQLSDLPSPPGCCSAGLPVRQRPVTLGTSCAIMSPMAQFSNWESGRIYYVTYSPLYIYKIQRHIGTVSAG